MFRRISVILLGLWAVGLATSYTMEGFIHTLFVLAIVMVLARAIQGTASRVDQL